MNKPKFNPSQPYEPIESTSKPKFDPGKPFEAAPTEEPGLLSRAASSAYDYVANQMEQGQALQEAAYKEDPKDFMRKALSGRIAESPNAMLGLQTGQGAAFGGPAAEVPAIQKTAGFLERAPGAAVNKARDSASGLLTKAGSKIGSISPEAATAYSKAPAEAEAFYSKMKNNSRGFQDEINQDVSTAVKTIKDKVIKTKVDALNKSVEGKSFKINPDDFKGTSVYPELEQMWSKRLAENPELANDPYRMGTKVELPSEFEVSGPDVLRLKRVAGDAAEYNRAQNPQGYKAKNDIEHRASSKLRSTLVKENPEVGILNKDIEEALRLSDKSRRMNNKSQLMNATDSIAGTEKRALRQYLDEAGGTNMEQKALRLNAAKGLNRDQNEVSIAGLLRKVAQPVAKGFLKAGGLIRPKP